MPFFDSTPSSAWNFWSKLAYRAAELFPSSQDIRCCTKLTNWGWGHANDYSGGVGTHWCRTCLDSRGQNQLSLRVFLFCFAVSHFLPDAPESQFFPFPESNKDIARSDKGKEMRKRERNHKTHKHGHKSMKQLENPSAERDQPHPWLRLHRSCFPWAL